MKPKFDGIRLAEELLPTPSRVADLPSPICAKRQQTTHCMCVKGDARYTSEATSHEAGHSFGLQHQSQYDSSGVKVNEYYGGPGDGRAPIMGLSYYSTRGLWWYGTASTSATTYQDDMSIIANATNKFGYRTDDYASTTPLSVSGRAVSGSGLIEQLTDQDVFTFSAAAGEVNLSVDVVAGVGNLNARLELRDSLGNLLAANDPTSFGTRRTITQTVAAGNYRLVVASHSSYGDVGRYTISGTIPIPSTIATPSNLTATASSSTQVDLHWTDNANNENGYVIERSMTGGLTWTQLAVLPADSNSFTDTKAVAGMLLYYRVSAFNALDVSSYANQASVTTRPAAPSSLTASTIWSDRILVGWSAPMGATGYKIQRSSDSGLSWVEIMANSTTVTSYQDSGLPPSSSFSYRVVATNAGGDSPASMIATAMTFALAPTVFGVNDGAYTLESWSGTYNDLVVQSATQTIITAGTKYSTDTTAPSDHRMVVAKYSALGRLDSNYGNGGMNAPPLGSSLEYGYGLALQSDGKAVVAGLGSGNPAAARFNTNGSLDTSFGSAGWTSIDVRPDDFYSPASAVGIQSTGNIVFSGRTLGGAANPAFLARLTASGSLNSGKGGFGPVSQGKAPGFILPNFGGTYNTFSGQVIQSDNKIVVVGGSYSNSDGGLMIVRYTADGLLDKTFNSTGIVTFLPSGLSFTRGYGIALQSDGKIVVVGGCTGIDGQADQLVARFNTNGSLDTSFGSGFGYVRMDIDGNATPTSESGSDVVFQSDGKIVIGGTISSVGSTSKVLVTRLNSNGTLDSAFGSNGMKVGGLSPDLGSPNLGMRGVALLGDGSIIVSGYGNWATANQSGVQYYHPMLMRFSGTSSAPAPLATRIAGSTTSATNMAQTLLLNSNVGGTVSHPKQNSTSVIPINTSLSALNTKQGRASGAVRSLAEPGNEN